MGDLKHPIAKSGNLLVEEVAGELLIYDVANNRAHCLNESAAAIWRHCDGTRSIGSLAKHLFPQLEASEAQRLVGIGVERLRRRHLVDNVVAAEKSVDLSKRHLIKKVAVLAAAAGIATPLVSSIVAPTAAHAFTCMPSGFPCTSPFQCCSGLCRNLLCA